MLLQTAATIRRKEEPQCVSVQMWRGPVALGTWACDTPSLFMKHLFNWSDHMLIQATIGSFYTVHMFMWLKDSKMM